MQGNSIWEHVIPCVTSACLIPGSSDTDLPVTTLAGTSSGQVEVWGEQNLIYSATVSAQTTRLMDAAVTSVASHAGDAKKRKLAFGDASGQVGSFGLEHNGLVLDWKQKVHRASVTCVAMDNFSADTVVASCSEDGTACISRGESKVRRTDSGGAALNSVLFLDPHTVALGGVNTGGTVRLWDNRQEYPSTGMGKPDTVTCLSCHPSLPYQLVAGDEVGYLTSFDLRVNKAIATVQLHEGPVSCLTFDPKRVDAVISGGEDGVVRFFDFSAPDPAVNPMSGMVLHSFGPMGCIAVSVATDELTENLLMAASEDDVVILKHLY